MSETPRTKLLLARDEAGFFQHAAQRILEASANAIGERGRFVLCLTGGSTPIKLYALLSEPYYRQRMDWGRTYFLWGDERCVPPTHPDSNYKMAMDSLLSKVPVPHDHIVRMTGETIPPSQAARAYEHALKTLFDGYFPKIDLMLLGVGDDGHTASLFPRTDALNETERWVVANHVPQLSTDRITLTFPVINNARQILFLVKGESKSTIVKEIFREDLPTQRYPAQRVATYEGDVLWLLDHAAISKCSDEIRHRAFHLE